MSRPGDPQPADERPAAESTAPILVTGASGQIGAFVLPFLAARGQQVLALSRHQPPVWAVPLRRTEWKSSIDEAGPCQALISAGPLALALAAVKSLSSLERVVAFSTASVAFKTDSSDAAERQQMQRITEQERQLAGCCDDRGIPLLLLRPTLVYGCGLDRNISRLAHWIRRWPVIPVVQGGPGLRQPVHAADLAAVAVAAVSGQRPPSGRYFTGGGEPLSYADMLRRIATAVGRRPRLWSLSYVWAARVLSMAHVMGLGKDLKPVMLQRQTRDLTVDNRPAMEALGFRPRSFHPRARTLQPPGENWIAELAQTGQIPAGEAAQSPPADRLPSIDSRP